MSKKDLERLSQNLVEQKTTTEWAGQYKQLENDESGIAWEGEAEF